MKTRHFPVALAAALTAVAPQILADEFEQKRNPRSKAAKLRWARLAG